MSIIERHYYCYCPHQHYHVEYFVLTLVLGTTSSKVISFVILSSCITSRFCRQLSEIAPVEVAFAFACAVDVPVAAVEGLVPAEVLLSVVWIVDVTVAVAVAVSVNVNVDVAFHPRSRPSSFLNYILPPAKSDFSVIVMPESSSLSSSSWTS
ncbi:hypothetical protein FRACYDRAFT_240961 [Fragilariopsis cylindrus CCMP1102]|uniref:Uncharacterized protein n=1 Tax=Fragilariopsis cylindrus CCMP1102 TaxID=635003 RepID=A0A1E7F8A3_9STRA|nr:hypothetical protein FRACYDRAFT_240961 [Fragilariopsis cylindrus CCMP1102]|eukprot:OEU14422.1 hypothetical protein FRACYDRAFT_240961 [Fragilariopsis cylindrus CCMP1102]